MQLNAVSAELAEIKDAARSASGKKKHEEEKDKQSEEIESLKAQLSAALKENEKLKDDMFVMTFKTIIETHVSPQLGMS